MKNVSKVLLLVIAAVLGMASCENVPSPFDLPIVRPSQDSAIVITAVQADSIIKTLASGETTSKSYVVEGYITDVFSTISNNQQSFWMADTKDGGKVLEAYWANLPDGVSSFKTGMHVKITGKLTKYVKTGASEDEYTAEMKNPEVEILDGGGDTPQEEGIAVTCAEAASLISELPDGATAAVEGLYTVTGYITSTPFTVSNKPCFYMDDTKDGAETIEAFCATLPSGVTAFTKGMKVKVTGTLKKYYNATKGTNIKEIDNITNVEILEGGGDTPGGDAKGTGTKADPYNVAGIIAYTSALAADVNSTDKVYFKGIVSSVKEVSTSYNNATFYISDDGTTNNQFYVFRCKGLDGGSITSENDVEVGDEVVIYGNVVNYKGNTPESVQKEAYIFSIKKGQGGDDPEPTPSGDGVSIEGTTVTMTNSAATAGTESTTIDLNAQGWSNGAAVPSVTMSDGTTITFDKGSNTNAPKFYTATKGVRVYSKNTVLFTSSKKIAKIVMTCDSYSGTNYVGNDEATVSFSGNGVLYTNAFSGSGSGVQLRVQTITVYYAK